MMQSNASYLDTYLESNVVVYRPVVEGIVDKLNESLTGTNVSNYENICQAGIDLTDFEMAVINWGRTSINSSSQTIKYSYAYDRENNAAYIVDEDASDILYSSTGLTSVPTNYRYLTGVNINTSTDLLNFSKTTNEWTPSGESTKIYSRPNEKNFYMAHNATEFDHAPLVIMNLNNNIDMSELETLSDWEPIANWYNFGSSYGYTSDDYSNCYDISILLNGNNHKFNNLATDVLFGALKSDSVLENFEINYNMGSESEFYDITQQGNSVIKSKLNSTAKNGGNAYWNFGIAIRCVRNVQCSTYDCNVIALIKNITLSGNCYVSNRNGDGQSGCDAIGIIGCICSEKYGGGEGTSRTGTNNTKVNFQDCSIFAEDSDNYYKTNMSTARTLYYDMERDGGCGTLYINGVSSSISSSITFTD